ncbi:unnamed protein product [Fusarium fujikuroi]|nr:unnamed protein product [Fusarium fujikuroi]
MELITHALTSMNRLKSGNGPSDDMLLGSPHSAVADPRAVLRFALFVGTPHQVHSVFAETSVIVQLKMKKGVMVITVNLAETRVAYIIFLRWKTIVAAYMRDIISKKHFASVNDPVHERAFLVNSRLLGTIMVSNHITQGPHGFFIMI